MFVIKQKQIYNNIYTRFACFFLLFTFIHNYFWRIRKYYVSLIYISFSLFNIYFVKHMRETTFFYLRFFSRQRERFFTCSFFNDIGKKLSESTSLICSPLLKCMIGSVVDNMRQFHIVVEQIPKVKVSSYPFRLSSIILAPKCVSWNSRRPK